MKLRYFLDWGGDILWAGDDEASDKYGYPVNMELLSISQESRKLIERLFILWLSLAQGSKSTKERENFNKLNEIVFKNLTRELQFAEIINEMPNISSQPTAYGGGRTQPLALPNNRFTQAHGLFTSIHLLKRLSAGCFAACRALPLRAAPVGSLFGR